MTSDLAQFGRPMKPCWSNAVVTARTLPDNRRVRAVHPNSPRWCVRVRNFPIVQCELIKSPKEHTLSSFDEVRLQRISETLDSIGGPQRIVVLLSFLQIYISDKSGSSVCQARFASSTVRSNVDQLFVFQQGGQDDAIITRPILRKSLSQSTKIAFQRELKTGFDSRSL